MHFAVLLSINALMSCDLHAKVSIAYARQTQTEKKNVLQNIYAQQGEADRSCWSHFKELLLFW